LLRFFLAAGVALAVTAAAPAATPEGTEKARARDCVDLGIEFDDLARKANDARIEADLAQDYWGASKTPEERRERKKELDAAISKEEGLRKRHKKIEERFKKDCMGTMWFVRADLDTACKASGKPDQGFCGQRKTLAEQGRLKDSFAEIAQRGKASPWRKGKAPFQVEPGGIRFFLEKWHTKVLAGNMRGWAVLASVSIFKDKNPNEFARYAPMVKAMGVGVREDRLLLPVLSVSFEHFGPVWDEERLGIFVVQPGKPPTPIHLQPGTKPGERFLAAFPFVHPEVHKMLLAGGRLMVGIQSRNPRHAFHVPFPPNGFPEAFRAFVVETKASLAELDSREESHAQMLESLGRISAGIEEKLKNNPLGR
jgi:hypothetical protein